MSEQCPTCGADVPNAPLAWLLRQCEAQTARLRGRTSRISEVVRAGRPRMRIDETLDRWIAASIALREVIKNSEGQKAVSR